jgi:hypothetical protein
MPKEPFRVRDLGTLDDHLSDTEASEIIHYRLTLDDEDRFLVEERYKEGLVLQDRAEFEYTLDGATEITTTKCYDAAGKYTGKVVGKFTPPDAYDAEVYDANDVLTDQTDGLFQYRMMNGKPIV